MKTGKKINVWIAFLALIVFLCGGFGNTLTALAQYPDEQTVHDALMAMRDNYPEGTPWTNSNRYEWKLNGMTITGYGCAAFAFLMSDAAFGDAPATKINDVRFEAVRVGDILRVNNDTHFVIITDVNENTVTLAEGNYNSSIHWGRTLTASEVNAADYMYTRYTESGTTAVSGVSLNKTELSLKVGESATLTATVTPADADNKNVTWSSSAPEVATVSAGSVTAHKEGQAVITVKTEDGEKTASCIVTVTKNTETPEPEDPTDDPADDIPKASPDASSVAFEKTFLVVEEGKSDKLSWKVLPEDAKDKSVSFTSSDNEKVKVDAKGNVTGISAGMASITVKTAVGGYTDECIVMVVREGLKDKVSVPETVSSGDEIVEPKDVKTVVDSTVSYKGENLVLGVTISYKDSTSYNGIKPDPEKDLMVKLDLTSIEKSIILNDKAVADGKKASDLIKVSYVCSKKTAGNATFYAKLTARKDAKTYLSSADLKKLKMELKEISKAMKKSKCSFTINKRSVTDGKLVINVQKDKSGAIKIKKGRITKVKSIVLNTKDGNGNEISIKLSSKDYSIDVIDADSGLIRVTGKKNFTGSISTYI